MPPSVLLRDVVEGDLAVFFEQQRDPTAVHMAAFTAKDPTDRAAFDARWKKILADDRIVKRTSVMAPSSLAERDPGNSSPCAPRPRRYSDGPRRSPWPH